MAACETLKIAFNGGDVLMPSAVHQLAQKLYSTDSSDVTTRITSSIGQSKPRRMTFRTAPIDTLNLSRQQSPQLCRLPAHREHLGISLFLLDDVTCKICGKLFDLDWDESRDSPSGYSRRSDLNSPQSEFDDRTPLGSAVESVSMQSMTNGSHSTWRDSDLIDLTPRSLLNEEERWGTSIAATIPFFNGTEYPPFDLIDDYYGRPRTPGGAYSHDRTPSAQTPRHHRMQSSLLSSPARKQNDRSQHSRGHSRNMLSQTSIRSSNSSLVWRNEISAWERVVQQSIDSADQLRPSSEIEHPDAIELPETTARVSSQSVGGDSPILNFIDVPSPAIPQTEPLADSPSGPSGNHLPETLIDICTTPPATDSPRRPSQRHHSIDYISSQAATDLAHFSFSFSRQGGRPSDCPSHRPSYSEGGLLRSSIASGLEAHRRPSIRPESCILKPQPLFSSSTARLVQEGDLFKKQPEVTVIERSMTPDEEVTLMSPIHARNASRVIEDASPADIHALKTILQAFSFPPDRGLVQSPSDLPFRAAYDDPNHELSPRSSTIIAMPQPDQHQHNHPRTPSLDLKLFRFSFLPPHTQITTTGDGQREVTDADVEVDPSSPGLAQPMSPSTLTVPSPRLPHVADSHLSAPLSPLPQRISSLVFSAPSEDFPTTPTLSVSSDMSNAVPIPHSPIASTSAVREPSRLEEKEANPPPQSDYINTIDEPLASGSNSPHSSRSSSLDKSLHRAIFAGDLEKAQQLLRMGTDPDIVHGDQGMLAATAMWGSGAVTLAMSAHAIAAASGVCQLCHQTILDFQHELPLIRALLAHGIDPHFQGGLCGSPLATAAWMGKLEIVLALLDYGADMSRHSGKYKHVICAAAAEAGFSGNLAVVQGLVQRGVNPRSFGPHGNALSLALKRRDFWRFRATEYGEASVRERIASCDAMIRFLERAEKSLKKQKSVGALRRWKDDASSIDS